MSINCNHENLLLESDEWSRIEGQCKKQKHICESDDLKTIIENDERTVREYGITFDQLSDFFDKVKYHYYKKINCDELYNLSQEELNIFEQYKIGGSGWCSHGFKVVRIFNDKIIVGRVTWGGAETCPFQSLEDSRYHGYEYGSHDWIFLNALTKESMHIGDLLFHQISKHHFFQSHSSKYRVDPLKLISLFGLKPDISYKTEIITSKLWTSDGSCSCSRRFYPDKLYSLVDIVRGDKPNNLKHENYGSNDLYYNYAQAFLVVNKILDGIPCHIDGIKFDFDCTCEDLIGCYSYKKRNFSQTTEREMNIDWL
jgi:hypothetical protein